MFILRIVCCLDSWSGPGNPSVNPRLVFSMRIVIELSFEASISLGSQRIRIGME